MTAARLSAVALVVVAALTAAGCRGDDASPRKAVNAYFEQVNQIQGRYGAGFRDANRIFRRLGISRPGDTTRLRRALKMVAAARSAVARLRPPPEAAAVHRNLVQLYRREANLAREAALFHAFVPTARRTLRPLTAINARFLAQVRSRPTAAIQAGALHGYAASLRTIADQLVNLSAPPALAPWRDAEGRRLRAIAFTSTRLAAALAAADPVAARAFGERLRRLLVRPPAATAAQRAAVAAYNRRIAGVAALRSRIDRGRATLERRLR